jgi:hypothetical protein
MSLQAILARPPGRSLVMTDVLKSPPRGSVIVCCVQAGHNLATMQSVSDMYSSRNVLFLLAVGALALVPVLLRRLRRTDRQARHRHVVSLLPIIAAGAGGASAVTARAGGAAHVQ